jgi:hypothetical protein
MLSWVVDWIRRLGREDHGLCLLHNFFARERKLRYLPSPILPDFFECLHELISREGYTTEPGLLVDRLASSKPTWLGAGPVIADAALVSRFITTADLVDHYGARLGLPIARDRSDRRVAELVQKGVITGADLSGTWRGTRAFCWVTESRSVDGVLAATSRREAASRVRDVLGKKGWEDVHVHILRVDYPVTLLPPAAVRVPTVLDGGSTIYFRPDRHPLGWGCTIDLQTLERGLPEAIHEAMPVSAEFAISYIGAITSYSPGFTFRQLLRTSRRLLQ